MRVRVKPGLGQGFGHAGEHHDDTTGPFEMPDAVARRWIAEGSVVADEPENFSGMTHEQLDELVMTDHRFSAHRPDYPREANKADKIAWIESVLGA